MNPAVYRSFFRYMGKLAEQPSEAPQAGPAREYAGRFGRALKPMAIGALGMGAGTGAGLGAGMLLEKLDHKAAVPGARAAKFIGPIAGAGAGVAYALYKQQEQKDIQDAISRKQKPPKSR